MRNFIILLFFFTTVLINAENKTDYPAQNLNIKETTQKIIDIIIKFQNLLPQIKGKIVSLPQAGTLGIEFEGDKISIHEGLRLVAKRKGIDKNFEGNGIIYLKYDKKGNLLGKYTRSEVGKFDIGYFVDSKWYKPVFVLGNFTDMTSNGSEFITLLKNNLEKNLYSNKKIKYKMNRKIRISLEKISTLTNYKKEMKKLFGRGIDYVVFANLKKQGYNYLLEISILSTYTSNPVMSLNIGF